MAVNERTDGKIHLGTIGMGIPSIYTDVVAKIISNHLAIESVLAKYINSKSLKPRRQFDSRLNEARKALGARGDDWSMAGSGLLNQVRNKCAHIDDDNYKSIEVRLVTSLGKFVRFVKVYNERLEIHKICDFDWACIMTYQRLHEIMELEYDTLALGKYSSLPSELRQHFDVSESHFQK